MKKKTFTIIELIIVMTILSIMFLMTKNYFTNSNKIAFGGENCINDTYNRIKEVQNAAMLGRSRALSGTLSSGANNITTPDRYFIMIKTPSVFLSGSGNPRMYFNSIGETEPRITKDLLTMFRTDPYRSGWNYSFPFYGLNFVFYSDYMISKISYYRGTGNIINFPNSTMNSPGGPPTSALYETHYLPVRGVNQLFYTASGTTYSTKCLDKNFIVSMAIPQGASGYDYMRIGFQTNGSNTAGPRMTLQKGTLVADNIGQYLATGAISFMVCDVGYKCKESHRLFIDTRANNIFLQKCSTFNGGQQCAAWQGGDVN